MERAFRRFTIGAAVLCGALAGGLSLGNWAGADAAAHMSTQDMLGARPPRLTAAAFWNDRGMRGTDPLPARMER